MRPIRLVFLLSTLLSTLLLTQSTPINRPLVSKRAITSLSQPDPAIQGRIAESYGKLPLSFEANHGQADGRVKFLSHTEGYTLFLTGDEAVLVMRGQNAKKSSPQGLEYGTSSRRNDPATEDITGSVLRMKLRNANPAARVTGLDKLAGTSNYFMGNDPAKWRSGVPTYAKVKYEGVYSGIDLVYYGNQRQLEYDFIVAPGADPHRIAFDVRGAKRIRRDDHGDLVLQAPEGEIRWHKPVVYQERHGARQEIAARYAITDTNRVGFELAKYDSGRPLYIDPLIYSTYFGGSAGNSSAGIAVDNAGNAYVVGFTSSTDFPTKNPLQPTHGGGFYDAFVSKLDPTGSALVYSTYLGGSGDDEGKGIAVDSAGNAYVVGYTLSTDFPTKNPLQAALNGGMDVFVAKLNGTGSALVYSTYLGGSNIDTIDGFGSGIAVDSAGNAYVAGRTNSTDFPTINPLQPTYGEGWDAFVAKLNPTGSALVYSTYLGGSTYDLAMDIAVDRAGNAYVIGYTESKNFPTTPGAFQTVCNGGIGCLFNGDAFVAKLDLSGSTLVYSSYLGGRSRDQGTHIAVDRAGNAYVVGYTYSRDSFPTVNALQPICGGGATDAFVSKVNPTGSALVYSTFLGGNHDEWGASIAVDTAGSAYVTGTTFSKNFPTTPGAFQTVCNGGSGCSANADAFVSKLDPTGSALVYSTFLGGSGGDGGGGIAVGSGIMHNVFLIGGTNSINFPTKKPLQGAKGGDVFFVARIDIRVVTTTTLSSSLNPSSSGQAVTLTADVTSSAGAPADGETVTFMEGTEVLGTGALGSGSASFTTSTLPVGTNPVKALYRGDSEFTASTSKAVKQAVN